MEYTYAVALFLVILVLLFLIVKYITLDIKFSTRNKFEPVRFEKIKKVSKELREIPVFVINMENRPDRKDHMIKLLDTLGFKTVRFIIPVSKEMAEKHPIAKNSKLTPAQKSSLLTYQWIFNDNQENTQYDKFIIMEDDIDIYNSNITMDKIYNSSKGVNWDLLYFEFCFGRCYNFTKISESLYKLPYVLCTGCTMFTRNGAMKLIANFNEKIDKPTDHYFASLSSSGKINSYGYPLFRQNPDFGSDLEGSFKNKFHNVYAPICLF